MKKKTTPAAPHWLDHRLARIAASIGGSLLVYLLLGLVALFLFERQPSSFIYVSF